ncbi:TIGR02206 family membrane protein [Gottschalkiaceae bacterium SANA]|nr:TIGR02206 family membrane protein [Gottschalkiaceae bacterium SANA]
MLRMLFWGNENIGKPFQMFGNQHLIALFLVCMGIGWVYREREWMKKHEKSAARILALLLLLQQGLLYLWYITSGAFSWAESLPLYPCRLSILVTILMLLKDSDKIYQIVFYWASAGATVALLSPDTSGFGFPHFMFIQYFIGHGGLLMAIGFMAWVRGHRILKDGIHAVYKWSLAYVVFVLPVNWLTGGNYGYLSRPIAGNILEIFPKTPFLYLLFLVGAMFLLFGLIHIGILRRRELIWIKDEKMS